MSIENVALAEFVKDRSNAAKRNALLASLQKLVYSLAHKYRAANHPIFEDLVQVGWEGAIRSIDTLDENRLNCFWSYVSYTIMGYMRSYINDHVFHRYTKSSAKNTITWHMWELPYEPTHKDCQALAEKYGYDVKDVINQLNNHVSEYNDATYNPPEEEEGIDITIARISLKAEQLFPGKGSIIIERILKGESWIDIEKSYELPGKTIRRMLTQLQEFV